MTTLWAQPTTSRKKGGGFGFADPAASTRPSNATRTLLRRFGDEAGETPLVYLQAARVRRARHLLETADRTVARIAADVGCRDPGTFGGIFVRHTGQRPRDYRARFRRSAWRA